MGSGPLAGVRVVELAGIGPGPFAAMMLADLGAEVLRVDRPTGPGLTFGAPHLDVLNRGRRNVAVDLKDPRGRDVVLRLVERADVLIEGFRPGVTERLGLGPEDCWARNPRLVYGRMTGWGQDGPLAPTAGHDIGYVALTGALHAVGRAGGPPQVPVNLVGDFGGGAMYLVVGVLAALLEARGSGRGQVVDAAIVDGAAGLTAMLHGLLAAGVWQDRRGVNLLDSGAPFYDVYETADGRWMAVGALEPQFYAALLTGLDLGDDVPDRNDPRQWPALRERFTARFRERTQAEWTETFERTDACVAPVLSLTEAAAHPHLAARGTFVEHAGVVQPAPAPRFSRTPGTLDEPPARPGQHTRDALGDWGVDDVEQLLADGVVTQT
ncbi:MAG: CaiB/BaiF CoA transferase family protein [Motilibacteraceae bacterium]